MKNTYAVAKVITLLFSLVVAILLWWFLRPYFITETQEPTPVSLQDNLPLIDCSQEPCVEQPAVEQETQKPTAQEETQPTSSTSQPQPQQPATKVASTQQASTNVPPKQPAASKQKLAANQRTVIVHNGIVKKMLGYKKFGTHYPTSFKLSVNKVTVPEGRSCSALAKNNTVVVRYDFEFRNGYRQGAKEVTFTLKPDVKEITLNFEWKREQRLMAEPDKVVSIVNKDVPYQA